MQKESGAHSDPQFERHMGSSLPFTSRREEVHGIRRYKQSRVTFSK